jgi:Tfp pilus assembly protein PilX
MSARSESPRPRRARKGFALPMAILALALMTAALIAAFSATSTEVIANSAMRAQDHAYQLAETGLEQFMLRRGEAGWCTNCVTDPTSSDSEWTKVNQPGGYATVVAMRIRPKLADGTPALFFVRSTGVDTMVKMSGAGIATRATRTVGQYATFGTSSVKALSAWTSLNGVYNGTSFGTTFAYGTDYCGKAPQIAGVDVPAGGHYLKGFFPGSPSGNPPMDSSQTTDSLKSRIGIDWNAIINYNAIPADYTVPTVAFPAKALFSDTSFWPVIRIKTNYTIPWDGQGIIIADSNLTFSANNAWDGIVLVGGRIVSTGTDSTTGATISGLNRILNGTSPGTGTASDTIRNMKRFIYNSCNAARAAARLQVYFAWTNTWNDNVAVW